MKIKRVLSVSAFCETGTMEKVLDILAAIGGKLSPPSEWLTIYGHRARGVWLGTQTPLRVEVGESVNDDLPMGKQHRKYAPAFQALGLEVENLDEAIAEVRAHGLECSDKLKIEDPSFEGFYESMIRPKSASGLLIELIEIKGKRPPDTEW